MESNINELSVIQVVHLLDVENVEDEKGMVDVVLMEEDDKPFI